ncbi:MAG: Fe-S cluster assembly protein SufD [Dehalococcoidia bacterium]
MTQAIATIDRYLDDFRALEASLAGEPEWLRALRDRAWSRFAEIGFPTARRGNEPWKYTNAGPIAQAAFAHRLDGAGALAFRDARRIAPWDDAWPRLVFVNGRYDEALSSPPEGVQAMSLARALREDGALVEAHLARQTPPDEADGFVALNTAFLRDGAFVHVPAGVELDAPLHLLFLTTDEGQPAVSYPRVLVVAAPNSAATIIESYAGPAGARYLTDAVTEMTLEDGARIDHYRLLLEGGDSYHVGTSRVYQGQDSSFSSAAFELGNAIGRADLRVTLDAPGGECHLNGLYITKDRQHIDNYINIDHAKPNGASRLYYKGILDGHSRAVFGGTVLVRPGAMKTDSYQEDKNLVLSENAEVDSKPSLEIYADDVKCGHGATAGAFTEDAMFYMRSRGLDVEAATQLLIRGFAGEILDRVAVASLRTYLEGLTAETLRGVTLGAAA